MAIHLGTLDSDRIVAGNEADVITALFGADRISAGRGADLVDAGAGNDIVFAGTSKLFDDGAADTVFGGSGNDIVYGGVGDTLSGGTDFDTLFLDLANATEGVTADFRPMQASIDLLGLDLLKIVIGATTVSGFEAVRKVTGSAYDDTIITQNLDGPNATLDGGAGNDVLRSGSGNDRLYGGDGNDRLAGGAGLDVLSGGAGRDLFISGEGSSSADVRQADRIVDFSHAERDRISLAGIDADTSTDVDDAFRFIGQDAFSGVAGELRVVWQGSRSILMGDTDGDSVADFTLQVYANQVISAGDLLL